MGFVLAEIDLVMELTGKNREQAQSRRDAMDADIGRGIAGLRPPEVFNADSGAGSSSPSRRTVIARFSQSIRPRRATLCEAPRASNDKPADANRVVVHRPWPR